MDLQKFRERLTEHRDSVGMSQEELADGVGINKSVLSEALNGKRSLTPYLVRHIIRHLAKRGAILGQSQALELLNLAGCDNFNEADWNAPPLMALAPVPSPMVSLPRLPQDEASQALSGETTSLDEDLESEKQDDKPKADSSIQTDEQVAITPELPKEQAPPSDQKDNISHGNFPTVLHLQGIPLSPKDRLEVAYQQLWNISETRFQFAGVVEALRKFSGEVAFEALLQVKRELEEAE
ncbi:MAG TPA: helix-turn-helix transcriptional regulator, partial [Ktedonobacteraceae bacterium]|nr:helix-turn-helix transcriptional regulator [Ktedonobacteraceae bacterium]